MIGGISFNSIDFLKIIDDKYRTLFVFEMLSKALTENLEKTINVQNDYCSEIGKHKADKTKFRDFDFLPKLPPKPCDKELLNGVEWERVEKVYEQCTNTEIKNLEIRRGLIKDDALIAVLSAIFTDLHSFSPFLDVLMSCISSLLL